MNPKYNPPAIVALLVSILILGCGAFAVISCTQAQVDRGLAAAQTASNILETINTDTGGGVTLFTQAAANAALKATHNSGDAAIVDATIAEAAAALKVQQAAQAAGLSSAAAQKITTATLTDPAVIQAGAAAAAGPTGSPVPTTMLKLHTDIRPPHGSLRRESAYDLSVVRN